MARTAIVSSVFGKSDGMLNTECNGGRSPAGIKLRDGKLWFPTQDGAAIINPEKIADNSALKIISDIEDVDGIFENEAEISIYRIIQESLNNTLKHAEAAEVRVSIAKTERAVSIKIQDDGKGFNVKAKSETGQRGGFGLLGMSERVRMLGGTISIASELSKGTTILINLNKI